MISIFSLISLIVQGPYLTASILILFFSLVLSFNAMYILFKDTISSLWFIIVILLGISFLSPSLQIYASIGWLVIIGLISVLKFGKSKINGKFFLDYIRLTISWFDLLTYFLLLLAALLLAAWKGGYFWAIDMHHPIYELSIGQSYRNALFNVPDLSYNGKIIRFHFLSTQIPLYFSHIFGISLLDSLYILSNMFFVFLSSLIIPSFFSYHPKLSTPIFFIFFAPSFIFIMDCSYRSTLIATVSYFLAFILIICALHFLISQKYWTLFFCSALLLLIKISFFMSLCGGIFIFWIRQKYSLIKFIIKLVHLLYFFLLINYLFLSGPTHIIYGF